MEGQKLFSLNCEGQLRVELAVRSSGERFILVHVFRPPTAEDKKRFWATMGAVPAGEGPERNLAYLTAQENLYDKCILAVEGYDLKHGSGEGDRAWVAEIPVEHKLWAVEKLLSAAGNLEREAAKN